MHRADPMRTTLNLPDDLLAKAKQQAAQQRTTVTALIETGLRRELGRRKKTSNKPIELPVFKGPLGLVDKIDLSSNAAMFDACDAGS